MGYEISLAKYDDVEEIARLARQSGELHQEKKADIFSEMCAIK